MFRDQLNTRREILCLRVPIYYTLFTQEEEQYAYADPNSNQPTPERGDIYSYVTVRPDGAAAMAAGAGSDYASISRPKQWEVPKRNVRLDKKLGSGHFGMVMKGFLKTKQGIQVIAVKMLKGWCARPQCLILKYLVNVRFVVNRKQLLDEVFVISGIIKVEVSVISRSRRLRL